MKSLFPRLETENQQQVLVGLKILKVKSTLQDVIKELECEDEQGEIHTIEFRYGTIVVDGDTELVINQGMF